MFVEFTSSMGQQVKQSCKPVKQSKTMLAKATLSMMMKELYFGFSQKPKIKTHGNIYNSLVLSTYLFIYFTFLKNSCSSSNMNSIETCIMGDYFFKTNLLVTVHLWVGVLDYWEITLGSNINKDSAGSNLTRLKNVTFLKLMKLSLINNIR